MPESYVSDAGGAYTRWDFRRATGVSEEAGAE